MISVGIDVSKGKSTVCIMKPGGEVLSAPFEVVHTKTELFNLVQIIKSQNEEVRVIMEDTGHYHLPVATLLVDNGIFVCSVNALRMIAGLNKFLRVYYGKVTELYANLGNQ